MSAPMTSDDPAMSPWRGVGDVRGPNADVVFCGEKERSVRNVS
jgi:hypothetical protein